MAESSRVDAALPQVPTGTHPWVAQWADRIGFGVSIFPQPPDWQGFIQLVQRMEARGIDSYWSYDHPAANADCWTALAAPAVSTERIRLGTMVDCIYYRSPFLLGGGGEKTTLRQVARYADASNMGARPAIGQAVSDDDIARKFRTMQRWCEEYGRPYESILRTHFTMPLVLAPTRAALESKLPCMPQDTLTWAADALFAGTPEEAITFYQGLSERGFQ